MSKRLWVERDEQGVWHAYSDEGAHLEFSKAEGYFDPGDLAKLALAACGALASQFPVENTLGENKGARIVVSGQYDADSDSFLSFSEDVEIDASDANLTPEEAAKLKERVIRHIDKNCTIKHTYMQETPVRMEVNVRQ